MSLGAEAEAALIALITEHHEQADQALERPLADWSEWLDSEGYGANDLDAFFLNPDLLQHWQGETALTDLYDKAIAAGQSTGQFIEALSEREPAYLEQTVEEKVFGVQTEGDLTNLESNAIEDAEQKANNAVEEAISGIEQKADNIAEDAL